MARKIKLLWLLLEIVGFIFLTSVIHASETEISNDDLKTDDETHVPDFFNVDYRKGHITKLLRRVVRGADDVVTLLNEAANTESNGVLVFDEVRELETFQMRGSKGIQMHIWNDQVIVSITDNTNMVAIYSMDINTQQVKPIASFPGISRCDLTSVPEGQLLIACINLQAGNESSGTDAGVRIYLSEESTKHSFNLEYHQFLHTNASSHLSLWQQHRETMLMVCSASWSSIESTTAATQDRYQSILYRWTGQYFDVLQRFSPSNTSAVHHFVINNQHFIAEAHFTNSKGHHNCYSTIFRYSSESKNYMPYQLIPTKGAKHFTSFSLHTDGRTNTFLAVANFCQDNHDGTCDPYTSSGIYCHHHDRFVLFQEIPTAHAFQWLVIETENTVLLAVANALTGVNMYQYNGWRFVLTELQYVGGPFGHGVTGLAAVKLDEKILLGISNQDTLQSNREMPVFFSITFRRENFLKTYQVESERWCGVRLQSLEEGRFINASAVDIPLSTDARYTFAEPVTIKGDLLVTKEGSTEKVFVRSTNETLPGLSTVHKSKLDILKRKFRQIEEILKRTIPIKGNITWPSGLYFRHLDSTESPDTDIIGDATGKYINGLPSSKDDLLQLRDNLRIPHLDIALVEIQVDAKVDKMLGRPFSAYTTLSGHHVTNRLRTFLHDLNAQEVNSRQIISKTADGNRRLLSIVSLQSLNNFQCSSVFATELHCGYLNGIDVTSLYENVVTTEDNHNITGLVKILDNVNYNSNLRTDVSSSINLQTPLKLRSHNTQIITGDHKVQDLEMNWLKVERINSVNIPGQLLLNRSDYSYTLPYANFTRLEANSVFIHSSFGSIQVKNGSLDVLTLNDDQFVKSKKVFEVIQLSSSDINRPKRSMEEMDDYRPWKVTNSIGSGSDYQNSHLDSSLDFVLSAVRSEAEINGLLYFMDSISPGNVLMPVCHLRYFKKLLDVSTWEFPYVHGELVLEGKDEPSKSPLWNRVNVFLNRSDVRMVIDNAKRYKMQLKERLDNVQLNWFDIYKMFETARESLVTALKKHSLIMEWIFSAFNMVNKSKESKAKKAKEGKYDATKSVDLTESEVTNHDDILDFICRTVQQISRYPMILRRLVELPTGQSAVMERAIMEHDFSWFLTIISKYEDVQLLKVDPSCESRGVADFSESIITILRDHRHHMASSDVSIRSKRNDKLIELRKSAEGIDNPDILGDPINPRSLITAKDFEGLSGYWDITLEENFNIPHSHDPTSGKVSFYDPKYNLIHDSGIDAHSSETLPETVNTSSFVTDNIPEAGKENDMRGEFSSDDQHFPQQDVDLSKLVRPSYEGSENMTVILVRDHRAIPTKVDESNIYVYPTSIQMTAEITDMVITASSKAIETPERMQELQVSGDQLATRMDQPIISPVLNSEYRNRSEEDVMATTRTVTRTLLTKDVISRIMKDSLFAISENTPKVSAFQIGLGSVEYWTSAVDSGIGIAMSSSESVVETHSGIKLKEISNVVLSRILSTPVHSVQNMIQQVNYDTKAFAKNMTASSILVEIFEYPFSEETLMSTPEFLYPSSIMLGEMKTSVFVADGQNSNTLVLQAVTKAAVTPENTLKSTLIADQHSQIPESVKTVESWTSQRYQQSHDEEQYSTFYIVENLASKFPDGGTLESHVEIESYPSVLSRKFSFAEEERGDNLEFDVMSTVSLDDISLAENVFPVADESLASMSSKISSVYVNVLDTSSPRQFFEMTRETSDSAKRDAISLISHYVVTDTMVYTKVSSIKDILDTDFTAEFSISTPGREFLNFSENSIFEKSGSARIVTSTSVIELTLAESDLLSTFVDVQSSYAVGVSMTDVDILLTPVESISTHLTKSTAVSVKYVIEIPVFDATIRPSIDVSSTSVIDIASSDLTLVSAASEDMKSSNVINVEFNVMYAEMTPIKDVASRAVDIATPIKSSASKSEVVDTLSSAVMSTPIPSPGDVLAKSIDVASTIVEAVSFSTNRISFESHSVTDLIGSSYSVMLITPSPKHMLSSAVTKLPLLQKAILSLDAITGVDYSFKPSIVRLTSKDNLLSPLTADIVHVLTSTIYDVLASYVDVPTAVILATPIGVISNFGEDPVSTTTREFFSSSVKDFKSSAVDFIPSRTIDVETSWKRSPIGISGDGLSDKSEILDASRSDWLEEGRVLESEYNTQLVEFMVEGSVIPVVSKETGPFSIHRTQRKSIDLFTIESVFSKVSRDDYVEKTLLPISVPQSMQELDVEKTSFITHDLTEMLDLPYSTLQPSYTTKHDIDHVTTTTLWSSTVLVLEPSHLPRKLKSYTTDRSIAPTKVSSDISLLTRDVTGRSFGTIDPLDLLHSNVGSETNGTEVLVKQPRVAGIIGFKELIDVLKETPKGVKNVQSSVSYSTSSSILESSFTHIEDLDPMVNLKDVVIPNTYSQLYKGSPSYNFEDVGKRFAHTTKYITQFTTFIKCISCTFIFKHFVSIVSSTVLVQTSPFTQTGRSFEDLGDLFDSMLLDHDNHFDTNSNEYVHSSDVGVAQQSLTPSSVVSTKGEELTSRMENIPDVEEVDDIFQGDNIDTSNDYDSTLQQTTTPLSVSILESEQLENILDYIQEFLAFASGNFSHDKVYVYDVDKDIGDVVDLNYKCLWALHSDLERLLTNAASLSKCKQSLEVGKMLSDDFGINPETISLLSSLRDASWLHDVISVLNIRLRRSHGQTLTHAEEEVLENVTKADRHIPVSPPVHKITKEMVTENLDRISTIKEALLKLSNMVNRKGPARRAREVQDISDIFSLSNTLRSYLKPLVDDTYDLTAMLPEWNVEELLENYRTLEQFYIDHPEKRTEEIDKIIRENDILIVKALSPVVEYENFEKNRLDHMTPTPFYDEEIMSTTAFAVEEDLYLADTERSLYLSVLQEYLYKLEEGLLQSLPIFAAYNGSNYFEDFSIKVIEKVQDNLDSIEENIWIFHEQDDLEWQHMEEFNVIMELIQTHVDQFTKTFVEKLYHLFDTIGVIRMKIIITAEHKRIRPEGDCDDVTLWSDSHALDTTLNLSNIVKSYLEDINSTIPWHLKTSTVLSTDAPVSGLLLSKVEGITSTVKAFVDDFLLALHSVDKVALKKEVDGLRITIDFTVLSNTNSFSDSFFTKLDYLKIILQNGIEKAKHIIKCLQTLKLDFANKTETPPSVTQYNSATTVLDDNLYGTTKPRTVTKDIAVNNLKQLDVVDNTDITHIQALLSFTKNIIVENPMDKTNVIIRSSLPDSSAISHTADAVLLTLKSIIGYLQNRTSEVSENLDNLVKQHSVLMKEVKGNVNRLNEEAKLKLLMIYGESKNGRAAVAEEQLLRVVGDVNLLASREPKLILPRNYMAHSSEDGVKYFDSWVIGKVAGYTLKDFAVLPPPLSPGQLQSYSLISENMNRLGRIVIHGELSVSKMNDVDVERLAAHAIPLNKTSIRTPIQFKQKVEITGDLTASRIDNAFAEKFVLCKDNAVFNQAVIFTRDVQVAGDVAVADVINGMDVSTFNSRIMLMNSNHKVFNNFITFTSLKAERVYSDSVTVSGIPLDQIVEKGKPSTIAGNKTFHVLEVGDSTHLGVLDVRYINNLDIPKMFRDSLWKSTGELQIVTKVSQFQSLILNSDITTQGLAYLDKANTYSTLYLPRMARNVVYKAKESFIISDIVLSGAATVQSLMFYNMFDGVPAVNFNYGWLSKISDQLISGRHSATDVNSSSVELKPGATIYGVEIDHLSGAVRLDESARFTIDVDFGEVVCHGSISTEGLVQGWNLTLEGVHKSSDIIIFSAHKIFAAMVKVTENLEVKGLVNTLDLRTECHTSPDHKLSIIGNVLIERTTSAQMLEAGKHIIDGNAADIYWQKDKNTVFKQVFFKHVNTSEVNSTINNINLSDLVGKILRKDCMHWDNVAIHHLTSNALNTASVLTNTLNGHPVSALGNILQKAGDQLFTGRITLNSILVEGDVSTGLQNKFDVSRFCQHQEVCHVHAEKFFSRDVSVLGAHQVTDNRTIQGVDVSEAFSNVLSNSGQILGMTRFQGNLILTDLRVDGLVDGVAVNKDSLLLRIGNQVMATPVSINSYAGRAVSTPEIEADEWAMGLMNISELNSKAVHRETLNILRESVNFVNEVQFNLSGMGLGGEGGSMGLKADTKLLLGDPQQAFKTMHHLSALNQNVLRDRVRELWGWLRVQIFEEPVERMTPIMVDSESRGFFGNVTSKTDLLALVPTIGSARILVHNSTEKQFEDQGIILEGNCTKRVAGYSSEGHEFVLTGHTCPEDSQQGQNGVKIWKLLPQGPQLMQFLSIQGVADMQMVLLDDKFCVLIVESLEDHTSLYCKESGSFVFNYDIDENPQKLSVLHHTDSTGRKMTFFAVANQGEYPRGSSYFAVWFYDTHTKRFNKIQEIELDNVVFVELASNQDEVLLVAVSQAFRGNLLGQVNIYRLDWLNNDSQKTPGQLGPLSPSGVLSRYSTTTTASFYFLQQILVKNPFEAHFSKLNSDLYLFIINQEGFITWFSQKGIQRFTEEGKLHVAGKQQLEVWVSSVNESRSHWIAVSGQDCYYEDSTYNQEDAQILRAVIRGKRFQP